jgi:hypothetical protein
MFAVVIVAVLAICRTCDATPPQVLSATYQLKETNLQGIQETHAIFQVNTDQDLYYLNDPHCGCVQNLSTCQNTWTNATVDETGYNITILTKDTWCDNCTCLFRLISLQVRIPLGSLYADALLQAVFAAIRLDDVPHTAHRSRSQRW